MGRVERLAPVSGSGPPHVVVIGGGMLGLSTAWFLQEQDVDVTVVERSGIAAGSSWGNAGWLTPGLAVPLSDPAVIRYGLKAVLDPDSPLYLPLTPDPQLIRFLLSFARRCTPGQWMHTMRRYVPVNRRALAAYDTLTRAGVQATTREAAIIAVFRRSEDAAGLEHEVDLIHEAGLELDTRELDSATLRADVPIVSDQVERAIRIDGQRFIDPGAYVRALSESVAERGGRIVVGSNAHALRHGHAGVTVEMVSGEPVSGDGVVLATGTWLPDLARGCGVRVPMRPGRGYSMSVGITDPAHRPARHPIYLPHERVACTPYGQGRLRVGGTMAFEPADAPLSIARIEAIERSARPLLTGVDWADRTDLWVGSRPVTVDGMPVVGATAVPRVWVNGGHGMWGMTLGPLSGQLLAEQMVTGRVPAELRPFDPTR